ncbi:MAG: hypothetical protein H6837_14930 [Planctomycetes bacterium]|nr:hypothetical protein [Planctomycetota bacterium]
MRHPVIPVLLAACLATAGNAQQSFETDGPVSASFWRTTQNCGANCLYLLLRAHGHDITYQRVVEATRIGARGSSLAELAQSARNLGFPVRLGKGSPEDLRHARLPILIHTDPSTGDVRTTGHYLVVTAIDQQTGIVHLFDGLSALKTTVAMHDLRRTWSGYVLEIDDSDANRWKLAIAFGSVLFGVWIFAHRTKSLNAAITS